MRSRQRGSRDTEKAFTERAIEATETSVANALVSPVVYVPRKLRAHQYRLTVDDLKITMEPEDIAENHMRIARADPLGFLIAAMNGQPLPEFRVMRDGSVRVHYTTLTLPERTALAKWMGARVTMRIPHTKDIKKNSIGGIQEEYDTLIDNAVERQNALQETASED